MNRENINGFPRNPHFSFPRYRVGNYVLHEDSSNGSDTSETLIANYVALRSGMVRLRTKAWNADTNPAWLTYCRIKINGQTRTDFDTYGYSTGTQSTRTLHVHRGDVLSFYRFNNVGGLSGTAAFQLCADNPLNEAAVAHTDSGVFT